MRLLLPDVHARATVLTHRRFPRVLRVPCVAVYGAAAGRGLWVYVPNHLCGGCPLPLPRRAASFPSPSAGVIPPVFGLDLSPIIGFTLLNALTSATVALGAEAPPGAAGAPAAAAAGRHVRRLPWQRRV